MCVYKSSWCGLVESAPEPSSSWVGGSTGSSMAAIAAAAVTEHDGAAAGKGDVKCIVRKPSSRYKVPLRLDQLHSSSVSCSWLSGSCARGCGSRCLGRCMHPVQLVQLSAACFAMQHPN